MVLGCWALTHHGAGVLMLLRSLVLECGVGLVPIAWECSFPGRAATWFA